MWIFAFITCISTSVDANQTQMVNRKAKAMSLVPHRYERVAKVSRQQAPDAAIHEVNTIGSREMDSRAETYCDGKNWRLLSTRGQLCDVKVFHN